MHSGLLCYHLGYWINKYAGWYKIRSFENAIDLVRWLTNNGETVESIDFIAFRID